MEGRTKTASSKKSWDDRAQELINFYHKHGHFKVPAKEYNMLVCWMKRLREWHDRGNQAKPTRKDCSLSKERVQELNDLGFPWKVKTRNYQRHEGKGTNEGRWQRRLQDLRDFKQKHGHSNVPCKFPENVSFGLWIVTVRKTFRKAKKGEDTFLTPERIVELDNLGFPWAVLGGGLCTGEYLEQREQELRREKNENEAFIKDIREAFSQMPQRQQHQMQELSSVELGNEKATIATLKKRPPTKEKSKKGEQQVRSKQRKQREKRKIHCDEADIQPSTEKKQRTIPPVDHPRNKCDKGQLDTRKIQRKQSEKDGESSSSYLPILRAQENINLVEPPSPSNADRNWTEEPPYKACEPTVNNTNDLQPKVQKENSFQRPLSLGERLRAKFEERLITVSL